jgi:hypothetical protein
VGGSDGGSRAFLTNTGSNDVSVVDTAGMVEVMAFSGRSRSRTRLGIARPGRC